ncbi:MAG: GNAT family N-acetyltransferase [Pseudomonadota bacterium]
MTAAVGDAPGVTRAHDNDAQELAAVLRDARADRTDLPDWSLSSLTQALSDPAGIVLVARFTGREEAAGFLAARAVAHETEIDMVAVRRSMRRRGVGRALTAALLTHTPGVDVVLEVAADNGPARALYAAFNFERVGARARYYSDGTDALILRRTCVAD